MIIKKVNFLDIFAYWINIFFISLFFALFFINNFINHFIAACICSLLVSSLVFGYAFYFKKRNFKWIVWSLIIVLSFLFSFIIFYFSRYTDYLIICGIYAICISLFSFVWWALKIRHNVNLKIFQPVTMFYILIVASLSLGIGMYQFINYQPLNDELIMVNNGEKVFNKIRLNLEKHFSISNQQLTKINSINYYDDQLIIYHSNYQNEILNYYCSYYDFSNFYIDDFNSILEYCLNNELPNLYSNPLIFDNEIKTPYRNNEINSILNKYKYQTITYGYYTDSIGITIALELLKIIEFDDHQYLIFETNMSNGEVKYLIPNELSFYFYDAMVNFYY